MSYTVTLIPGDGIGPEVTQAARICVDALRLDIKWEVALAGKPALEREGELLPSSTLDSIRKNKVALKGPIITPVGGGFRSINVALRQKLDLFACLRPTKSIEGVPCKFPDVDIIVIRENTEGLYAGIEFDRGEKETLQLIEWIEKIKGNKINQDSAITLKPISWRASCRISEFAFQWAEKNKRKKVTCVHKANIMKASDTLFLNAFYEVAKKFPQIESEDIIVDNLCMQLVKNPQKFDILLLPNLYGDIVSDLCAGLVGGLGVSPGANIGNDYAVFEPVHGAVPKYAGKAKVNPTATILSAVLMLRYLGEEEKAEILEKATREVIKEAEFVTYDLKKEEDHAFAASTFQMAEAIAKKIEELS